MSMRRSLNDRGLQMSNAYLYSTVVSMPLFCGCRVYTSLRKTPKIFAKKSQRPILEEACNTIRQYTDLHTLNNPHYSIKHLDVNNITTLTQNTAHRSDTSHKEGVKDESSLWYCFCRAERGHKTNRRYNA